MYLRHPLPNSQKVPSQPIMAEIQASQTRKMFSICSNYATEIVSNAHARREEIMLGPIGFFIAINGFYPHGNPSPQPHRAELPSKPLSVQLQPEMVNGKPTGNIKLVAFPMKAIDLQAKVSANNDTITLDLKPNLDRQTKVVLKMEKRLPQSASKHESTETTDGVSALFPMSESRNILILMRYLFRHYIKSLEAYTKLQEIAENITDMVPEITHTNEPVRDKQDMTKTLAHNVVVKKGGITCTLSVAHDPCDGCQRIRYFIKPTSAMRHVEGTYDPESDMYYITVDGRLELMELINMKTGLPIGNTPTPIFQYSDTMGITALKDCNSVWSIIKLVCKIMKEDGRSTPVQFESFTDDQY